MMNALMPHCDPLLKEKQRKNVEVRHYVAGCATQKPRLKYLIDLHQFKFGNWRENLCLSQDWGRNLGGFLVCILGSSNRMERLRRLELLT